MVYIKKLVMHGFKSFVRKTEIPFTPGINVVLGPNGSGKSNISDALCFVLGRLSVKSMRAAKAKNLIFLGAKGVSPAKEASVEIVFDNSDKIFSLNQKEISIKRIVKKNGQSIYKINGETKTRQQILTLLAQAGIDPNGFNIILQGEIQNFVRLHTEERRKIIEEVSGISIYEIRKEKSLKELNKIEEKLKDITSIMRERTAYLNNLEKERQQALKFKKLEQYEKIYKASIIYSNLSQKRKEYEKIESEIYKRDDYVKKIKDSINNLENLIKSFRLRIEDINSTINKSTGFEQEKINKEIADLRAEIVGLGVKKDNIEKKVSEIFKEKQELLLSIKEQEKLIKELQEETPTIAKKTKDLNLKKQEMEKLEEKRKKFYMVKSELKSVKELLYNKKNLLKEYQDESEFLLKQIKSLSLELFDIKSNKDKLNSLKIIYDKKRSSLEFLNKKEIELEKVTHTNEHEISNQTKILRNISKIDICPLCRSKITKEHLKEIEKEILPKIKKLEKEVENSDKELNNLYSQREILIKDIEQISLEISNRESDLIKLSSIEGKKEQIKNMQNKIEILKEDISQLEKRNKILEKNLEDNSNIEQKYETMRIELQEISSRTEENLNSEIVFKQRELERTKISLKQSSREEEDLKEEFISIKKILQKKEIELEKRRKKEEELARKFKELISERDSINDKIHEIEKEKINNSNKVQNIEQEKNNFKIDRARIGAEIESLESEMLGFNNIKIIKLKKEILISKLAKTQNALMKIGSVNLRSLEVYDEIKKEYDIIKEKVEIISKEKKSILRIISEIDIKKKKTFLTTLKELNEIFSRNFSQLSSKGQVSLELEHKKDPFSGGVTISVKTGHGKYFDVTSLSGGEQTLVALSLIFAIQELKPYYFYILDEIDAALDKRNSERLAHLLKKYMKKGQYIVITHNDEVILNATNLYGVSMHDGISKIISLKI